MNCQDFPEHLMVLLREEEGWGGGGGGLGFGVRIVMEYLAVTTNYVHIGQQHDRNDQLVVHYSTIIPYQVKTKFLVERK